MMNVVNAFRRAPRLSDPQLPEQFGAKLKNILVYPKMYNPVTQLYNCSNPFRGRNWIRQTDLPFNFLPADFSPAPVNLPYIRQLQAAGDGTHARTDTHTVTRYTNRSTEHCLSDPTGRYRQKIAGKLNRQHNWFIIWNGSDVTCFISK